MCEAECPNQAISMGNNIYQIDSKRCTECIGYYNQPTCQQVCPLGNTIIPDPNYRESSHQLWNKFLLLRPLD